LETKIVRMASVDCHAHRLASASYYTAQICVVQCTKLRNHFHAIVEVFYYFTVAIGLPGDASCIRLQ